MSDHSLTGSALLTNDVGLHARPSVKLTQLAKRFGARIEFALDATGPWVDAKSPVRVMRFKAKGQALSGPAELAALSAISPEVGSRLMLKRRRNARRMMEKHRAAPLRPDDWVRSVIRD
jgi:phosphocarrier protein